MVKIMTAIYKNRFIYKFHIGLYVSMLVYIIACLAMSLEARGVAKMEVWEFFVCIGMFVFMFIVEHVALRDPDKVQTHPRLGYIYNIVRIVAATIAYYYWVDYPIALAFLILLVLFSIETPPEEENQNAFF